MLTQVSCPWSMDSILEEAAVSAADGDAPRRRSPSRLRMIAIAGPLLFEQKTPTHLGLAMFRIRGSASPGARPISMRAGRPLARLSHRATVEIRHIQFSPSGLQRDNAFRPSREWERQEHYERAQTIPWTQLIQRRV